VQLSRSEDLVQLKLPVEVKSDQVEEIARIVEEALAAGAKRIEFDFSEVDFMDSRAIGQLVRWHVACQQRGSGLRLSGLNDRIRETLAVTNLLKLLNAD
jgi:anti-anti-sigma factor